jgi:predicted acylesterase/phospholipase RssA
MSVPGFFPGVWLVPPAGTTVELFVDGGLVDAIPTVPVDSDVTVVSPYPVARHSAPGSSSAPSMMRMLRHTVEHLLEKTKTSECDWLETHNRSLLVVRPTSIPGGDRKPSSGDFLTFDDKIIKAMFEEGYQFTKLRYCSSAKRRS